MSQNADSCTVLNLTPAFIAKIPDVVPFRGITAENGTARFASDFSSASIGRQAEENEADLCPRSARPLCPRSALSKIRS
jgi:hypothetical protein